MSGDSDNQLTGWLGQRLGHIERVLGERRWLATDRFTIAHLLMADVLRVPEVRAFGDRGLCGRVTDRPSFRKAWADQIALFEGGESR